MGWSRRLAGVYYGVTLRRHTTASVWRRGREATGAELLFLRGCEGENGNMQAIVGNGKCKHSGCNELKPEAPGRFELPNRGFAVLSEPLRLFAFGCIWLSFQAFWAHTLCVCLRPFRSVHSETFP